MDIGAAGQHVDAVAGLEQLRRDRLGAGDGAPLALAEELALGDPQGDRLGGDDVLQRAALLAGEDGGVDLLRVAPRGRGSAPPRGPPSVLWVVVVTTSAPCATGFGCRPAATRPAKWAMSTISSAPTSSAISRKRAKSSWRG